MRAYFTFLLVIFLTGAHAQELFPHAEPASNIPKGVLGIRYLNESFKEIPSQRSRYWNGLRFMYGVTGRFTIMATGSVSNHHPAKFPADLRKYFINHHQKTYKQNPTLFEGINVYAKYRIFSLDEKQKHLRIALYGEAGKSFVPHDEAEPGLNGDNTGFGGGVIITQLYKRFAASFTTGFQHPLIYVDKKQSITFKSGDATMYKLSLGYRLLPFNYSSYKDINVNIYLEFINKHYTGAEMTLYGLPYDFSIYQLFDKNIYNSLQENKYSELRPSIQFIFNSNTRIDLGMAAPIYSRSYLHFYPMFFFHLQKYFFPKKEKR